MKNIKVILLSLTLFTTTAFQAQASELIELVEKNDIVNVKKLFKSNKKIDLNQTNKEGDTALHIASKNGSIKITKILIKAVEDLNQRLFIEAGALLQQKNECREIELDCVCENDYKKIIERAAEEGALLDKKNKKGNTALHIACKNGKKKIAKMLIKAGADLNKRNTYKETALHCAYNKGNTEIVELLIKAGADLNKQDCLKRTAFHIACECNTPNIKIIKMLIKADAGLNLNLPGRYNKTPLMLLKELPTKKLIRLFKSLLPVSFEKENNESEQESNEKKFIEFGAEELATQFKNEEELSFPPNSALPHNTKLVSGDQQERMAILLTIFQNYFEKDTPTLKHDLVSFPVIPHITTDKKNFNKLIVLLLSFHKLTPEAFNQLKCWRSIAQTAWQKYNNTAKPQLWDISIKFKKLKSSVKFEEIPTHQVGTLK